MVKASKYLSLHPKQKEAFKHIGTGAWLFYGGARGGGKTHLCLAAAVMAAYQFPGVVVVCIRKTYPELDLNFIENLQKYYPAKLFKYTYLEKRKWAKFDNGSIIAFRACENEKDTEKVRGLEFQFMIIDEANLLDEMTIVKLAGSLRNAHVKDFIPTLFMTGNPGGISDLYFKTRFISPDHKRWDENELERKDVYKFISAKVDDNPSVDDAYRRFLKGLPPKLRAAWYEGRWDVFEGQFFEEWNEAAHVMPSTPIPSHWDRVAGLDLGYTDKHPTVCLWGAQDPETLEIHIYREYIGVGVVEDYAEAIKYEQRDETVGRMYADPSMFNSSIKNRADDESPDRIFLNADVFLLRANNDRINGWRILKQWLHWSENRPPKLRIHDCCMRLIETLPMNRYDTRTIIRTSSGEDLDTKGPDDCADALRYLLMTGFGFPTQTEALSFAARKGVVMALNPATGQTYEMVKERMGAVEEDPYAQEMERRSHPRRPGMWDSRIKVTPGSYYG